MIESTHVYLGDPMSLIRVTGAVVGVTSRRRCGGYVLEEWWGGAVEVMYRWRLRTRSIGRVIYRSTEFINKKEKPNLRFRVTESWTRALLEISGVC